MTKEEEIIDNIARLNSQTWRDREEVRTKIGKLLSELKKILEQQPIAEERYQDLIEYFGDDDVAKFVLEDRKEFKKWLERIRWNVRKADELARNNPRYAFGMESIEKQECKQGKWIRYEQEFTESGTYRQIKMPVIECSICQGKIAGHIGIMNYCPNCGAEMVGVENG